ncbi:MAG: hypothetical protein JWN82_442 [Candidatus Saccharibacteria bacterium]|nr:hypothetical protein [Candidatus Saccharibacteria bacterium]
MGRTLPSIPEVSYTDSMRTITLITGNAKKLREWQRQIPDNIDLSHHDADLVEIQGSPTEIVTHKLHQAYELVDGPVVVEDVSLGLRKLHGLPGPYVKHFIAAMGDDALTTLVGDGDPTAEASCTVGYYDGSHEIIVTGTLQGSIVPRRGEGFGFDPVFMPVGESLTFAEMTPEQKDAISHRHLAINKLLKQLAEL